MTQETESYRLSRRNVLAGIGGIGVASAGAGLGTSAYFNDTESFENNTLTAGTLDLKVDWQEHYSHPQVYGFDDPTTGLEHTVYRSDPEDADYVGLPDPENPVVWVHRDDLATYMRNTSIEAYPDVHDDGGGDGVQDPFAENPGEEADGVGYVCEDGADMERDLDPTIEDALRTKNADTWDAEAKEPKPLVSLDDVKPGDFGELTLSYHLCDNPGYVWLNGSLRSNAENDVTEPEAGSGAENNDLGDSDSDSDGELLDAIRTRVWYDDGDNVVEVDGDSPDDAGYVTPTLSLGELLLLLESGDGIQLCPGGGNGIVEPPESGECDPLRTDYDSLHVSGDTVTVDTPLTEDPAEHTISDNPRCTDFGLIQGLKTDEAPEGPLPESGEQTYSTPFGDITVTTALVDGDQTVTDWSIETQEGQPEFCVAKVIVKGGGGPGGSAGANVYSFDNDNNSGSAGGNPDEPYNDFTDDETLGALSYEAPEGEGLQTPTGQDISHVDFCLVVSSGSDGENGEPTPENCCFEPSTDHYIGVAWWLPEDVGNEVQSDSVGFDLGFYAEQCRHNERSESV
ncbi:SipW-dependent-type signal peptide-containing protein [Halobellus captivus]|uniref:SipW-dependent-type signal peptide-containing protein n=1 Tax=Halobellus captivus TaxID=2592614 RepID=UPI001EF08E22|nr:SipW-dependent-type signal peptide-containing protein [Halobellus captivus]